MKARAAKRLRKFVASPAHMEEKISKSILIKMTGLLPNVFANGTQNKLEAPNMRTFTARRCVSFENGVGGKPKIGVDA